MYSLTGEKKTRHRDHVFVHLCLLYFLIFSCIIMIIFTFVAYYRLEKTLSFHSNGCSCEGTQRTEKPVTDDGLLAQRTKKPVTDDGLLAQRSNDSARRTKSSSSRRLENSSVELLVGKDSKGTPEENVLVDDGHAVLLGEPNSNQDTLSSSGVLSSSWSKVNATSGDPRTRFPRAAKQPSSRRKDKANTTTPRVENAKRNKKPKKNHSNQFQGVAAIHLQAPDNIERQYESGPMVSFNTSNTKDTVYRFWRKANWVSSNIDEVLHLDETTGHVTVEVEGLYLIYAQLVYHDLSGRWSFGIYVGDQERVKCLATEQLRDLSNYHQTSHGVYQSCYTAIVVHIRKNQSVSIRCMYGSRTILTRPEFTFWGIVKFSG